MGRRSILHVEGQAEATAAMVSMLVAAGANVNQQTRAGQHPSL